MPEIFRQLFSTNYMPHAMCLRTPDLIWLHAICDSLIALAYFLIPFGLIRLLQRRRDLAFHWLFILFATFILSCGATHILSIITLWVPIYRFSALVKVITAIASLITAVLLIRLIPKIATLPSPEQWRLSNEELRGEIINRKAAESALMSLNLSLERRVEARTRELELQNLQLQELKTAWDLAHGFIRKPAGLITFWCEGSEQLYGWRKEEATGRSSHELLRTSYPKPLPEIESELEEKGTWTGELLHTTKSGELLHVATHWILQRDASGAPVSVIEVNNDITDRLRAVEASRRLADLVESSNDAIIGSTLEGNVTSWNTSAEQLFGYSSSEMVGHSIDAILPSEMRGEESGVCQPIAQGRGANRFETIRVAKGGKQLAVSLTVSPIRNSDGDVIGTSQIIRDISEAKAREEAFRLSEERQRLAVDAGQVGLWYLDVQKQKSIWTSRCKELHGLPPDAPEPAYPDSLSLVHADDRKALVEAMQATLNGAKDLSAEYRTRGLDSRGRWVQARGRAQRDSSGQVTGIHGTVIDLTARREMEDKLRRMNTELEQFAYAAAHDLQEPLRNVALSAALLKGDKNGLYNDPEDQATLFAVLIENARRMEAMVKDLLTYSRSLDNADQPTHTVNANQVLQTALDNLSSAIEEKHADIRTDTLPSLWIHETHLLQVFQNLIGNALKYTGAETPHIQIGAITRDEDVLLFVKDNGVGISPQFHERAFRMFKRLHDGPVKGTGIGLAVCKRIVEHYGGRIWIESEAGSGATFFFTIPGAHALTTA